MWVHLSTLADSMVSAQVLEMRYKEGGEGSYLVYSLSGTDIHMKLTQANVYTGIHENGAERFLKDKTDI